MSDLGFDPSLKKKKKSKKPIEGGEAASPSPAASDLDDMFAGLKKKKKSKKTEENGDSAASPSVDSVTASFDDLGLKKKRRSLSRPQPPAISSRRWRKQALTMSVALLLPRTTNSYQYRPRWVYHTISFCLDSSPS